MFLAVFVVPVRSPVSAVIVSEPLATCSLAASPDPGPLGPDVGAVEQIASRPVREIHGIGGGYAVGPGDRERARAGNGRRLGDRHRRTSVGGHRRQPRRIAAVRRDHVIAKRVGMEAEQRHAVHLDPAQLREDADDEARRFADAAQGRRRRDRGDPVDAGRDRPVGPPPRRRSGCRCETRTASRRGTACCCQPRCSYSSGVSDPLTFTSPRSWMSESALELPIWIE